MKQFQRVTLLATICFCLTFSMIAKSAEQNPYELVQKTTDQVVAIINDIKGKEGKDSPEFRAKVLGILDPVIDFERFARGVMGTYANEQKLKSLTTDAEKKAFQDRVQRFSLTFKQGVVDTYASSLLEFNGGKIVTLPPGKGDSMESGFVNVRQEISNKSSKAYVIQYSMRRNPNGEWKLRNLIIEGVNLGLIYRSQFASSADANKGDIDKVIANWKVDPEVNKAVKANSEKPGTTKSN